jgi:hypothetical protein
MTIKDLIHKLEDFNPDREIVCLNPDDKLIWTLDGEIRIDESENPHRIVITLE